MKLPRPSIINHGFTLIEIIIVMAIIALLAGLGSFISVDIYRSISFNTDSNYIAAFLKRARSEAINNIDGLPHGIKIMPGEYVIFSGYDFASRDASKDEVISGNSQFSFFGPTEIVFSQLSGNSTASGSLVISNGFKTATISLNYEGRINF